MENETYRGYELEEQWGDGDRVKARDMSTGQCIYGRTIDGRKHVWFGREEIRSVIDERLS